MTASPEFLDRVAAARDGVLVWEDPPPPKWGRWNAVLDELKTNPGVWARIAQGETEVYARQTVFRSMRRKGAEAICRKIDGEGHSVWARWPAPAPLLVESDPAWLDS